MVATPVQKLSNGMKIEHKDDVWTIVDYAHHKPGKGGAVVRLKIKSMTTGRVLDETLQASARVETTEVSYRQMSYLYRDGEEFVFMDNDNYEQVQLPAEKIGDGANYLVENGEATLVFWKGDVIGVDLPSKVTLEVVETFDAVKGDTSTNVTKDATLETGYVCQVPLFVNQGDKIVVDTRDGSYESRA